MASFYLKQYRDAADAYRASIKLDAYNAADAYYALGLNYRDSGQFDDEVAAYKNVLRLRPDYTSAYDRLGQRYLQMKKYSEAIEAFKQLSMLKPGDANVQNSLGEAYVAAAKNEEATETFRQAIRLKPDHAQAHWNLSHMLLVLGLTEVRGPDLPNVGNASGADKTLVTFARLDDAGSTVRPMRSAP